MACSCDFGPRRSRCFACRIIKLHLPDLKASKAGATLQAPERVFLHDGKPIMKKGKMLDEEPAEEEAVDVEGEEVPAGNATGGNSTGPDGEAEEGEEEDGIYGFGPGLIPPHASTWEPCCMCPLYDDETGEIEGWIGDAPADPHGSASNYIAVAEAVAMREERLDDLMGADVIDPSWLNPRFQWADGEGTAPSANETGNSTAGNSTDAEEGEVEEAEEEAAEAEVAGGVRLAAPKHAVTHLAQKAPKLPPLAEVVGKVVDEAARKAATARQGARVASVPQAGQSPLQRLQVKKSSAQAQSALPPQEQAPLQAIAQPMASAAAAVARGHLPSAVAAIAPQPQKKPVAGAFEPRIKMKGEVAASVKGHPAPKIKASSNKMSDFKAAPVAAARHGPADAGALPPVQAVAEPLSAAGAARKPVQAVAQPILPVKQVAKAV